MAPFFFLLLILAAPAVFAQTSVNPQAVKFDELGAANGDKVESSINAFYADLSSARAARGFIFNFGTDAEIEAREIQIRDALTARRHDHQRISMVRGGETGEGIKTEFWIVPPGAEPPVPGAKDDKFISKSEPTRLEEIGEVSDRYFSIIFKRFLEKVKNEKIIRGYIVIRAARNEADAIEKRIRNLEFFQLYDSDKIVFLRKEPKPAQATVALWFVPQGAEFSAESGAK